MKNNRTQRLLLCVLLSLVVHAGLAATFVSAIRSKPVHLEIVNPIQVSLVQDVFDAIGTAANQLVESDLSQFLDSGTQPNSIDLIQLAEESTDSTNEVTDELVSAAVASVDANQLTEVSDINQLTPPLPIVKKEATKEIPDAEVQPFRNKSSDISPNTEQLSEPNELESTESAYVKVEEKPMPTESESVRDLHLTEPVENLTSQVSNSRIDNEIEHKTESGQDLVSNITPFEFSLFEMHESAEAVVDSSDADKIAGIWLTDVIESETTKFDQPLSKESSPEEIAESQTEVTGIAELSYPVSITAIEAVQFSPPELIDVEHITDEIASTSSHETETDIDNQFTDVTLSNIPKTAYSRISDGLDHLTDSEIQPVSDITPTEDRIPREQKSAEHFAEVSDADELAGIWPTEVIEPATIVIDQPPSNEPTSEKTADSEIQVASISELPNSVANLTTEISQVLPPEIIELAHFKEGVPANTSSQTVYFEIDSETEIMAESDYKLESDITPVETPNVPVLTNAQLAAEIPDAEELAGSWPTEEIEPAVVDSDHLPSSEVTSEEIEASQIQVASASDLIEPVQHDTYQVEPEYLPSPTFPVSGINQTTTDLDKETTNEKTVGLNDSWFTGQLPTVNDQLAYTPPKLEPTPIREEIHATYKTQLEDEPLREADPPEITNTEQVIEPEVDGSETKLMETASETSVESQPEFDNSSPLTIHESPGRIDLAETNEKSIPKERHQVASIDPVQQKVNRSAQGTTNTVTQKIDFGGFSSDVAPKYGIKGLPNQAPRYPYLSRVNDEQGRVILRVVVDRKGKAKEVKVLESSGYSRLDKAARKAVKRWRFQPAQKNGQSTQGVVQVPINFVLESS